MELIARTLDYLTGVKIKAVVARRDKIVKLFEQLIAQKGEAQVLY